jgi:hypothetical protein
MANGPETIHNRQGSFTFPTEAQVRQNKVHWDGLQIQFELYKLVQAKQLNPHDQEAVKRAIEKITSQSHLL